MLIFTLEMSVFNLLKRAFMRFVSVFVLLSVFCTARAGESEPFIMPMKVKPVVSGSFAELRTNHFHSGIDLTTVGKIGCPVLSVFSGFVSRVKVSSGGYGKAIYVEHPNGLTSVYAHLDHYSPSIDSLVRAHQYNKESFEVEIHLNPGAIPVGRGEVIAFSGNSGSSGGPHLHFELRDTQTQEPVDPMPYMTGIKDDVPPVVYGIKLYPLSSISKIGAGTAPVYLPVVASGKQYVLKENRVVTVAGKIGIGVHVTDFLTENHRKCGVSDIQLFCGDQLVFHSNMGRFSFSQTRYINSYIDYHERMRNSRFIQKSFVEPNNRLSNYIEAKDLVVEPGEEKNMRYEIRDVSGNLSVVSFILKGGEPRDKSAKPKLSTGEHQLYWRRGFSLDTTGLSVYVAPGSVYQDQVIRLGISQLPGFANPVYQLGSDDIPVHEPYELSIDIPAKALAQPEKAYIAYIDSKNKANYMGGSILNNQLVVKSRVFGRFTVLTDTQSPSIVVKTVANGDHRAKPILSVTIKDDQSGIAFYRCEVNGQWQLFEYDPKTSMLSGDLRQMNLKKGTKHQLVVKVQDSRGNERIQKYSFLY